MFLTVASNANEAPFIIMLRRISLSLSLFLPLGRFPL